MITRSQFLQSVVALFVAPKVIAEKYKAEVKEYITPYPRWYDKETFDWTAIIVTSMAGKSDNVIFTNPIEFVHDLEKGYTLYRNNRTGEIISVPYKSYFYHGFKDVKRGFGSKSGSMPADFMLPSDRLYFIGYAHNG